MSPSPTPQRPLLGAFYMLLTGLLFVGMTTVIKSIGSELPSIEIAFLRFVFGAIAFLPMVCRSPDKFAFDRALLGLFSLRGACHVAGTGMWFYALTVIDMSDVTAINYMVPIFLTIGAALIFGERLAWMRICAIIVAFVGVLIILRPGFQVIELGHIAMMCGTVGLAGSYLLAKRLSQEADVSVVVAMMSFTAAIGMAPFALAVWVMPSLSELLFCCLIAAMASAAHYFMTVAFKVAPMVVVQPVSFLQLVWATLLGAVMFGEVIDGFVVLGGIIIVASVSFITWRETVVKRASASDKTQE